MINAGSLSKNFGDTLAVNNVSISVENGQIFGLLGPNAAGKSTLIRMLCGVIESDSGETRINGKPVAQAKSDFGYVAQHFGQYEELSVWENLTFYASLYGIHDDQRLLQLLQRYDLTPHKNKLAGQLSGGYKRRLALSCALTHDPNVLFLDEPTAGIDPVTRKLLWDDFYKLAAEGKTLFVTTHYMEEAQRCHELAFISSGRIVATGTPDSIKQALGKCVVLISKTPFHPDLHSALNALEGIILINQFGDELRVVVSTGFKQEQLQSILDSYSSTHNEITTSEPNLEDVFIALTQVDKP